MYLADAQTIVRARTGCVSISIQSLTVAMAAINLHWMAVGTKHGIQIRIFTMAENNWESWQLEFVARDHHVTHALTYALAEWFVLHSDRAILEDLDLELTAEPKTPGEGDA